MFNFLVLQHHSTLKLVAIVAASQMQSTTKKCVILVFKENYSNNRNYAIDRCVYIDLQVCLTYVSRWAFSISV